ncbi:hypothetical protein PM8797T_31403 [Gimesia maris DSM 8797]|uniref:Uncharacterized protein n=2 Tax=Gimesia maris TaxID=122 RepID=A0ABX5YM37_9PLAN|nr:hypothetical protein PM8797T_31403 [Gimesia maris DSM 8797]QEG16720.1 hypothetical protein GmarT_25870 [Gimesia maris]
MADVRFKIKRIKRGYGDKAFWKGVVSMIAPEKLKGNPAKATGHVQWQWRNRLLALKKAGYAPALKPLQMQFARNCPPASVLTDQSSLRHCTLQKICPFCWGRRYVFKAWNHACPAIITDRNKFSPRDREVVWLERNEVYDSLDKLLTAAKLNRELEQVLLKQHCTVRGAIRFEAFFVNINDPKWLMIRRSTLALTEGYNGELQGSPYLTRHWQSKHINKRQLSEAVACATSYPPALLKANAEQTKNLLDATKGIRSISFRGCMR